MGAQAVRLSNVDIDNALKSKDFEVLFQPIFDLGNGALARMETFVRWRHPSLGVLPPGAFLSFFESQGRMSELTRYVLAEALTAYSSWRGVSAPGFSINLALSDLSDEAFTSHFAKLLRDQQFPADLVTLECPMPAVDMDIDIAAAQFSRLSETGARLAIEVRGRANDLLRMIDPFPFDEIKTGGSSILRFARTVRGPGLSAISDLLDIANRANAVITAVGVEDQASLSALRGLGFTAAQGNHLGKVGALEEFMPGRVNEVRSLLELEPLSTESLDALFRTGAPSPKPSELETLEVVEENESDPLVDRLNERVSKEIDTDTQETAPSLQAKAEESASDEDAERKAKAREKAKALVLAKRAKARAARKAAAIARAKAKAASPTEDGAGAPEGELAKPAITPPHELQERLNQEFAGAQTPQAELKADSKPAQAKTDTPPGEAKPARQVIEEKAELREEKKQKQSVPEKVAAAMGGVAPAPPAVGKQKPPSKKAAPSQTPDPSPVKMEVGEVHAYFQPGISVGGPALEPRMETSETRAAEELNATIATAEATPDVIKKMDSLTSSEINEDSSLETASDQVASSPVIDSDNGEQPDYSEETGDLHDDDFSAMMVKTKTPARKSFLKRTVLPYPTHFWPKAWKRSYRRLTAKQPVEETVQAAE